MHLHAAAMFQRQIRRTEQGQGQWRTLDEMWSCPLKVHEKGKKQKKIRTRDLAFRQVAVCQPCGRRAWCTHFSRVNIVCRHSVQQGTDRSQMSERMFSFSNAKEAKVDIPPIHVRAEVEPQWATLQLHSCWSPERRREAGNE